MYERRSLWTALLTPVLFWVASTYGWREVFLLSGGLGLIWAAVLFFCYREPSESRIANEAELAYIRAGGAIANVPSRGEKFRWDLFWKLLTYRQIWGVCIGKLAATTTLYFFLTWFATYLVQEAACPLPRLPSIRLSVLRTCSAV